MKKLIFSLVIAIVSSVNVFGQSIYFSDESIANFTVENGSSSIDNVTVRTFNLNQNNSNFILDHNANITKIINDTYITKVEQINLSGLEDHQYFLAGKFLYYKTTDGFVAKFVFYGFTPITVSVGNQIEVSNLTLYPNPVQDVLNIRFDSYENVDVVVTDLNGRIVYNENVSGLTSVDLSNQPSGIYFVNVGSTTRKVVKQ